jgi:hypothetical protein
MTEPATRFGAIRRFFGERPWIGYGAAYLVIVGYTFAGAGNLYTAVVHGYVHAELGVSTYESDPVDFVVKVAISCIATLVLGTVSVFATVGWLHVWRQKWRSRRT